MGSTVGLKLFRESLQGERERIEAGRVEVERVEAEKAAEMDCMSPRSAQVGAVCEAVRANASTGDVELLSSSLGSIGSLLHKEVVNSSNADTGESAIHIAAAMGFVGVMQTLAEASAELDSKSGHDGQTALLVAAKHGQYEVVEWLLSQAVQVDAADNSGKTAIHHAAMTNHGQIFQLLVRSTADLMAVDNEQKTALELITDMQQWQVSCSADRDINHPYYSQTGNCSPRSRPKSYAL